MSRIAVLGDGGWGSALALLLQKNGHAVTLWGRNPEKMTRIRETRENLLLPGVALPPELDLSSDMQKAVSGTELVVLATPSQYMRGTLTHFQPFFQAREQLLVNVSKGIENNTLLRMEELTKSILGPCRYAVLSGPSHAEEAARGVPTAVVAASADPADAECVRKAFMQTFFRVYTASDVLGVELGGSLKNVLAIAAGIVDGMKLGDNTKAALMTRGIAEMTRLGIALGGSRDTFPGLSGIGDLIVTCMSRHSRNRFVGESLGQGRSMAEIRAQMGSSVAEGVATSVSARDLARKAGVEVPIVEAVHAILFDGLPPRDAMIRLMTRDPKREGL